MRHDRGNLVHLSSHQIHCTATDVNCQIRGFRGQPEIADSRSKVTCPSPAEYTAHASRKEFQRSHVVCWSSCAIRLKFRVRSPMTTWPSGSAPLESLICGFSRTKLPRSSTGSPKAVG